MHADADHYEAYYAEKLWSLLPAIYRAEDGMERDERGPLRELVERLAVEVAVVRRSIDRLWEDQSIETCDAWCVAYVADLLSTNLVASLDGRGQRRDVAKTIYYRRRAGTLAVLEEIARDVTGWDARVVELFRRLARTRHALDPALDTALGGRPDGARSLAVAQGLIGRRTRTPIGGLADLRDDFGAGLAHSALDEAFHAADVRHGRGSVGWYGISRLGVFVWRLQSFRVVGVDPVAYAGCDSPRLLAFDPTGREIQLFAAPQRAGDASTSSEERELPGPLRARLLDAALRALRAAPEAEQAAHLRRLPWVYAREIGAPVPIDQVTADPRDTGWSYAIDPERGRLVVDPSADAEGLLVGYFYGFSGWIGAGAYDRRVRGPALPEPLPAPRLHARGGGDLPAVGASGTLVIDDSRTYRSAPDVAVEAGGAVVVTAGVRERPLLRLDPDGPRRWTFTGGVGGGRGSALWLDGVFVSGGDVVLAGAFGCVTLTASTLDPGAWDAANGAFGRAVDGAKLAPSRLVIEGSVQRLVVDRCITGPIAVEGGGSIGVLSVRDSIVQAVDGGRALVAEGAAVELARVTLLGRARVRRLYATDAILHDKVAVADHQHGCVRFSAWATGSALPRRYESIEIAPRQALFTSSAFGHHAYAQLLDSAPAPLRRGANDGSEMGAFSLEKNPIKERSLLIKYREYMPIGLAPVVIHVT